MPSLFSSNSEISCLSLLCSRRNFELPEKVLDEVPRQGGQTEGVEGTAED